MSDTRTLPKYCNIRYFYDVVVISSPMSMSVLFMIIKAVGMSTNKFGFLLLYKKRELKMKGRSYKKRELKEKRRSYKKRELKMKLNAKGTTTCRELKMKRISY